MSLSITPSPSIAAIGLSGMRAAQRHLDTSAHNIANAQTPGFQRQTVVQIPLPGNGGVETQVQRETAVSGPSGENGCGTHLAEDLIGQRMSLYSFAANLKSVQAQDRMLGALLDTKA